MDNNRLNVVEYLILDVVWQHGNIDDFAVAKQLRCSRSFLLSKLERLLFEGYLVRMSDGYALSEKGKNIRIPLTYYVHPSAASVEPEKSDELFDWSARYIPPIGWNN